MGNPILQSHLRVSRLVMWPWRILPRQKPVILISQYAFDDLRISRKRNKQHVKRTMDPISPYIILVNPLESAMRRRCFYIRIFSVCIKLGIVLVTFLESTMRRRTQANQKFREHECDEDLNTATRRSPIDYAALTSFPCFHVPYRPVTSAHVFVHWTTQKISP